MYNFIHNISRKLVYKFLNIVNIEYKLYALCLKHIQDIIVNRNTKFVNFPIQWIGYQLRDLNLSLASLSVLHSDRFMD
jgi:hypothetical protein